MRIISKFERYNHPTSKLGFSLRIDEENVEISIEMIEVMLARTTPEFLVLEGHEDNFKI